MIQTYSYHYDLNTTDKLSQQIQVKEKIYVDLHIFDNELDFIIYDMFYEEIFTSNIVSSSDNITSIHDSFVISSDTGYLRVEDLSFLSNDRQFDKANLQLLNILYRNNKTIMYPFLMIQCLM